MRTIAAATALAVAPLCQTGGPASLHTVLQKDPWMMPLDAPSAAVSADGRYVAFASYARLAPADTNNRRDIYVLDRQDGHVTLESLAFQEQVSINDHKHPRLSADGRLLVYETASPTDGRQSEIVLRDRAAGTARIISVGAGAERANGSSSNPEISRDGRVVAFASTATNLVTAADVNGSGSDIYVLDVRAGAVSRISVGAAGAQSETGVSVDPSVSGDGRFVVFASTANLDPPVVTSGAVRRARFDVYVRDRERNLTRRVSAAPGQRVADGASWMPTVCANGRYVAFVSAATNLADRDRNRLPDVFLADLQTASIELVSRREGGGAANGTSGRPAISDDGRYVAFQSEGSDLLCARRCTAATEDINLLSDVFLLDRQSGELTRVSGDQAAGWMEPSSGAALDATGGLVVFSSRHPIDATDTQNDFDLFVRASPLRQRSPSSRAP